MAWYRLAETLGCTVGEAQARLDSRQFSGWCAYFRASPPLPERLDLLFGLMTANVMNALGTLKKSVSVKDVTADFTKAARPPRSREEIVADAQERLASKFEFFGNAIKSIAEAQADG